MTKFFAWVAFVGAIIAGAGLAGTAATLVLVLLCLGVLAKAVIDIAKDKTPNMDAIIAAIVLPSLIVRMRGTIFETLDRWLTSLWDNVEKTLGDWAGAPTSLGVAVAVLFVSFIIAKQTAPSGNGLSGMVTGRR